MATPNNSIITFPVLLILLLSILLQSTSSFITDNNKDPLLLYASNRDLLAIQRTARQHQQIPSCSEMVSRSQCSQNPKCRWCKSEDLDDMCFSKTEAWRFPQQFEDEEYISGLGRRYEPVERK